MANVLLRSLQTQLSKFSQLSNFSCSRNHIIIPVTKECVTTLAKRGMASGPRKMVVQPSRYPWTRFKNDLHFYILLTGLPIGAIILYSNFIIGEAELAEIPEGYEPKNWEYHKHPISRWFARYIYEDPVKQYEMEACKHVHIFESARHRAQLHRVKEMMAKHDDYRSYYFVPAVDPRFTEKLKEVEEHNIIHEYGTGPR